MKCEEECNKCREKNFILAEQIMAPLPKFRLKEPLHVFALTAANCGRPYIVSEERRNVGKRNTFASLLVQQPE